MSIRRKLNQSQWVVTIVLVGNGTILLAVGRQGDSLGAWGKVKEVLIVGIVELQNREAHLVKAWVQWVARIDSMLFNPLTKLGSSLILQLRGSEIVVPAAISRRDMGHGINADFRQLLLTVPGPGREPPWSLCILDLDIHGRGERHGGSRYM